MIVLSINRRFIVFVVGNIISKKATFNTQSKGGKKHNKEFLASVFFLLGIVTQ